MRLEGSLLRTSGLPSTKLARLVPFDRCCNRRLVFGHFFELKSPTIKQRTKRRNKLYGRKVFHPNFVMSDCLYPVSWGPQSAFCSLEYIWIASNHETVRCVVHAQRLKYPTMSNVYPSHCVLVDRRTRRPFLSFRQFHQNGDFSGRYTRWGLASHWLWSV